MEQILPENWAFLHLGLVFSITLAQMLVVYVLSDAHNPPAGLGLFTVYFMAALLGWIAVTLQQGSSTPLVVDVPSVASIINSYILFMAAGQRSGVHRGRITLGAICLVSCLSVFFLSAQDMFLTQAAVARAAGIGTRTVRNVEGGNDTQLSTLLRILRALGRLDALDAFLPRPGVSPMELLRTGGRERQRAGPARRRRDG